MSYVCGEYLVIYDAEDKPHPDQLLKALSAFRKLPDNYVCLQARLNFYNGQENILTRLFSIEYKIWFNYLLQGLSLMDLPVTLGGTSNHFKVSTLKEVGYWDAYNVTEDADLGLRLYMNGFKVGMIDSETLEESPITLSNWLNQRSRWIKGFMQSFYIFLIANKNRQTFPLHKIYATYIFVGLASYSFFCLPWFFCLNYADINKYVYYILIINSFFAIIYLYSTAIFSVLAKNDNKRKLSLLDFITLFLWPLYFILHSIASYKALWECIITPFSWNKTKHGQSTKKEE